MLQRNGKKQPCGCDTVAIPNVFCAKAQQLWEDAEVMYWKSGRSKDYNEMLDKYEQHVYGVQENIRQQKLF